MVRAPLGSRIYFPVLSFAPDPAATTPAGASGGVDEEAFVCPVLSFAPDPAATTPAGASGGVDEEAFGVDEEAFGVDEEVFVGLGV